MLKSKFESPNREKLGLHNYTYMSFSKCQSTDQQVPRLLSQQKPVMTENFPRDENNLREKNKSLEPSD